ncbi:winged helix-turn-helix domain-containing protein [Amycolatopsis pigmentata]|uniref:Winged helix-turn-helix domain-containing protein n=1 Tax=Amycolatopsis pigmentata TaxID=450801 RepID=A0ABW5FKG9_9PSEU
MTTLVMARPRQGTVGERERMVHLFEVDHHEITNGHLAALCSKRFNLAELEFLNEVTGMPCEVCLSRAPRPTHYRELFELESNTVLNRIDDCEPPRNASTHDDGSSPGEPNPGVAPDTDSIADETRGWNSREFDLNGNPLRYRYEMLADHLARMIIGGEIPPNKRLPAEPRLANEYGVSLGTARRAIEELRLRGLVCTLRSKGTFVLPV